MAMIKKLYAKHYDITVLRASPGDQGHDGVARQRIYLALALRGQVVATHDVVRVYKKVTDFIRTHVATRPRDYLVATEQELKEEARKTATTRAIEYRPAAGNVSVNLGFSFCQDHGQIILYYRS